MNTIHKVLWQLAAQPHLFRVVRLAVVGLALVGAFGELGIALASGDDGGE